MIRDVIYRYVRRMFTDEVLRDMVGSSEVVAEIEREWEQLIRDRNCLRQIFPNGNSKVGTSRDREFLLLCIKLGNRDTPDIQQPNIRLFCLSIANFDGGK